MNALLPAPLVIATRESRLAMWQAEHVRTELGSRFGLAVELLGMSTRGDEILDRSLSKVGGKGLFVKELENALEDGRAHLAVHSLKDVPMEMPPGFVLAAVWQREDPRDALVLPQRGTPDHAPPERISEHAGAPAASLAALPPSAVVGTSSLRRMVQLLAERPDLRIEPLRGNLDTRLRKLDGGGYDAIVLAAAGLKRLGLAGRIAALFDAGAMIPAAGQGALGLEVREDASALRDLLAQTTHRPTWLCTAAERAVSRALGGSCSMPLAAHAVWSDGCMTLDAALGDGVQPARTLLRVRVDAPVTSDADAEALGAAAAARLHACGAAGYLQAAL